MVGETVPTDREMVTHTELNQQEHQEYGRFKHLVARTLML